jgi:hypothetical protein
MRFDELQIDDVVVEGIDYSDYPDFCDAYIESATIIEDDGEVRDATDEELDRLNDDRDFVYSKVIDFIY